jgi:F-type H+-transporting ATPase subunit a
MRDAVLHDVNKVNFFGLEINPGLAAGFTVTGILTIAAIIIRIFVIPKFKLVPGKFQATLELLVGYFGNLSKTNSPHLNRILGGYVFAAGVYIFTGTMLELFGIQVMTTNGSSVSMPAPLSDINGAIMMGCTSYLFIMTGGIAANGLRGITNTLKEYSLPISMSFRLFGALLSGALVTELVYYFTALSYVVPVLVGVMFTCLHALIQAYVLTMLVSLFYGEVSEPPKPKQKKVKAPKVKKAKELTV